MRAGNSTPARLLLRVSEAPSSKTARKSRKKVAAPAARGVPSTDARNLLRATVDARLAPERARPSDAKLTNHRLREGAPIPLNLQASRVNPFSRVSAIARTLAAMKRQ